MVVVAGEEMCLKRFWQDSFCTKNEMFSPLKVPTEKRCHAAFPFQREKPRLK